MIPRLKPALGWSELKAVFSSSAVSDIVVFERSFAKLAKQKHAVAFPYGRTALVAILHALGLEDAEILCPSYTCVVVQHAVVTSGNTPVFIDPDLNDFNMDLNLIDEAMTPNTRAIICTSLFGHPVNLGLLKEIRSRYPELIVIQDCAHSFFCEWERQPVHQEGICAFYALNISKIMTSIFGGMVTTNDDDFFVKLRDKRDQLLKPAPLSKSMGRIFYLLAVYVAFGRSIYGVVNRLERMGFIDRFVKYYDPGIIDMPDDYLISMTPVEARAGTAQCKKYESIVTHRRKLAQIYMDGLADQEGIELPPWNAGATYSHFVIRSQLADKIITNLRDSGIQLGNLVDYYIPDMPAYTGSKTHGSGHGRALPEQVINLPVHMGTSEKDAMHIVRLCKSLLC